MSFWIPFWKIIFIVVLLLFTVMAVWVTIGGFRDIKKLFGKMEEMEREKEEEEENHAAVSRDEV